MTPPDPPVLRLASSGYGDQLAQEYGRLLPNVKFQLVNVQPDPVQSVLRGSVDLSIALADQAYYGDLKDAQAQPTRRRALRAIGVLEVAPLHLLVRPGSGFKDVSDLRGRLIGTITGDFLTEWVLKAFRLSDQIVRVGPFTRAQLGNALTEGSLDDVFGVNKLDALFLVNMYPATLVKDLTRAGARLIPVEGRNLADLSAEYPFVQWISIPAHVYPGQADRIRTLAVPALLVCRSDLDDELVYQLASHLLEAVSQVPLYNSVLRHIAAQDASATPIPLHDGAARYYREYEILQ